LKSDSFISYRFVIVNDNFYPWQVFRIFTIRSGRPESSAGIVAATLMETGQIMIQDRPQDIFFMKLAFEQARLAAAADEVPVGAVLVDSSRKVMATAHNQAISLCDPTAHAEILAIRAACQKMQNYRLLSSTLYVTIEPCVMCMGAVIHARVERLVFGAPDPKWGAVVSVYRLARDNRFNHRPEIVGGVLEDKCRRLIQDFFRSKRTRTGTEVRLTGKSSKSEG